MFQMVYVGKLTLSWQWWSYTVQIWLSG